MKTIRNSKGLVALLLTVTPLFAPAAVFFSDTFSSGSTLNQPPAAPTINSASYQSLVGLAGGTSSINPGRLSLTFPNTGSVLGELLAKFSAAPISLTTADDHIAITVVFVNSSNIMSGLAGNNSTVNIGLFNSSGVLPNQGHIVSSAGNLIGGTEDWNGYMSRIFFNGSSSVRTRPPQTPSGTTSQNQDLLFAGASSTQAYNSPAGANVGTKASIVSFTQGSTNTLHMVITLTAPSTLVISNALYAGAGVGGTAIFDQQYTASGGNFLTSAFDGLAVGWRNAASASQESTMDILSIEVSGQATTISAPPDIVSQPVPVNVSSGGSAAFSVTAQGFNVGYQWHRYGTNLVDGGNISGATSDLLVISPAGPADAASGANGYWVTVSGAGGFTTNSTTNSLTLVAAKTLTWAGPGDAWDLNTSANWLDAGSSPSTFNFGDSVTFNGGVPSGVVLTGRYLSASSVTVEGSTGYAFSGTGSFAGPGALLFTGTFLDIGNANTYSGGTIISNAAAYLYLRNYAGLGTGPVTLAKAGGLMEVVPAGNASVGINGDIIVADDFTIQFDGNGAFAGVIFGNLSGTAGKTLTMRPDLDSVTNRYRVYGASTVYDANLVLEGAASGTAIYDGTVFAPYNTGGSQVYNGVISGNGGLVQRGNGTTILNGQNTYSGGTVPTTGTIAFGANTVGSVTSGPIGTGALLIAPELPNTTGSGAVQAFGGARTIANPIQYPSATNNQTLVISGTNSLTFTGPYTLNGNDGTTTFTNRILQVDSTGLTTISGVASGNGFGLIKTGSGVLALSANNSYTGRTAISNGTLLVNGSLAGGVTVANGTLGGSGTINGDVLVTTNGYIFPQTLGTLTINNNLSLSGGNLVMYVNRSGFVSDRISVSGTLVNSGAGTVTIVNVGGAGLVAGDTFTLFNKPLANGNAMTVTGSSAIWTNKLAVDGTVSVVTLVATSPTNITYSLTGNTLTLSWPANYLSWSLQSNIVGVASTGSWFPVPNSASSTQMAITVNPARSNVFYRLVAP